MARWIGIDYGKVRTGLAVTDSTASIAFPHATIKTDQLMDSLTTLIGAEPCAGIVLGIPNKWGVSQGKGTTHSTADILAFQSQLQKKWPSLAIELVDETNTSEEALTASIQAGMKKSNRSKKGALDKIAATLILQRFIDSRMN